MILTDSMLTAAFNFRKTEPWMNFTDSDIFAVRLSSGETGYCSIMGHAGQHHALGFYIGDKGFSAYLKTIFMSDSDIFEMSEVVMTFDCINCDFMNAADIEPEKKKIIKAYAELNGVKVPRPYGWPDFTRFTPNKMQWHITSKDDGKYITEALVAATYMVEYFEGKSYEDVGLDPVGKYPTRAGGKKVPLLIPQSDGSFQLSTTKLPALRDDTYPAVIFENDILSHKIMEQKPSSILQCRFLHMPAPTNVKGQEVPVFPALLLCVDTADGFVFPVCVADYPENPQQLLADFANILCSTCGRPPKIFVNDDKTKNLLNDFCRKCGIIIKRQKNLPQLEDAYNSIISSIMGKGSIY